MGRPPCCDTIGLKKGPWTPEEDIILVSYIQEHGPGNWRAVPTNTGLMRCSKSCRLRWANYLRPGIKRGAFTDQEEKLIIHLQALLGNRWAAIASYLAERTDNDIKNYWNTHLRKKLRKLQASADDATSGGGLSACQPISRGRWESRLQTDIHMAKKALSEALSLENPDSLSESKGACTKPSRPTVAYASSTENISRLLEGWMRNSPKPSTARANSSSTQHSVNNTVGGADSASSEGTTSAAERGGGGDNTAPPESMFRFDSPTPEASEASLLGEESKASSGAQLPLSLIETWLFDESGGQGEEGLLDMQLDDTALYGRIEKLDDTAAEVF